MAILFIDGDVLPYEIGYGVEKDLVPDWHEVKDRVDFRVEEFTEEARQYLEEPVDVEIWLSEGENFRKTATTICDYKGNRKDTGRELPVHFDGIRQYLVDAYDAQGMPKLEGDDAIAIRFTECNEVKAIASIDKDFNQLKGYRFAWGRGGNEGVWYNISEKQARISLWTQLLVGDRTDNIPGLFGVGPASALVKDLYGMNTHKEMYKHVYHEYERRFGNLADLFFSDNLRMVKLLEDVRHPPNMWAAYWLQGVLSE